MIDVEIAAFARDVREGLSAAPKHLHCRYFYDESGSRLFEEICTLDEYYLPRAEAEILTARAKEIASLAQEGADLVELGSGNAAKTRLVIRALLEKQGSLRYLPIDVSHSALEDSARALRKEHARLEVVPIRADYEAGLAALAAHRGGPRLILWLGSNIGNFHRAEAALFLAEVRKVMSAGDGLVVGVDLRKDKATLEAAYDDTRGVTGEFNKNILRRINRELGGNFDVDAFAHRAVYEERIGRIEMYLVSRRAQQVSIKGAGLEVAFGAGEAVHTENSYKYDEAEILALAGGGLDLAHVWTDAQGRFAECWFSAI